MTDLYDVQIKDTYKAMSVMRIGAKQQHWVMNLGMKLSYREVHIIDVHLVDVRFVEDPFDWSVSSAPGTGIINAVDMEFPSASLVSLASCCRCCSCMLVELVDLTMRLKGERRDE